MEDLRVHLKLSSSNLANIQISGLNHGLKSGFILKDSRESLPLADLCIPSFESLDIFHRLSYIHKGQEEQTHQKEEDQ
jgi:hypothetical protein